MRHKPPTPPALEPSCPHQHPACWWLSPISTILVAMCARFLVPATRIINSPICPGHAFQTPLLPPSVVTSACHLLPATTMSWEIKNITVEAGREVDEIPEVQSIGVGRSLEVNTFVHKMLRRSRDGRPGAARKTDRERELLHRAQIQSQDLVSAPHEEKKRSRHTQFARDFGAAKTPQKCSSSAICENIGPVGLRQQ